MNITEAISKSNMIIVEGQKRVDELLFPVFINQLIHNKEFLIFSFYEKVMFLKTLESIKNIYDSEINSYIDNINFLNIKQNHEELKRKYGYGFMLQDIKKAYNEFHPKCLIFHRFDLIFEAQDYDDIKEFIIKLIEFCNLENLKAIIVTNREDEKNRYIQNILENYIELLFLTKEESDKIEVKSFLLPLDHSEYKLISKNDKYAIIPTDTFVKRTIQPAKKVLLVSSNDDIIKLNKYIFYNKKNIELIIADNGPTAITKIMELPNLVIYCDESEKVDLEICKIAKESNKSLKVLYISGKQFLRTEDTLSASDSGCYDILTHNFHYTNYILILEKILDTKLHNDSVIEKNSKEISCSDMKELIKKYLNNGVFFTVIKTNQKIEQPKSKLRNKDIICQKEKNTYIICQNIRKINIDIILKKLDIDSSKAQIYEASETDLIEKLIEKGLE